MSLSSPPTAVQIVDAAKQFAAQTLENVNPLTVAMMQVVKKLPLTAEERQRRLEYADHIRRQLSVFADNDPQFSERTVRLEVPGNSNLPPVILSGKKNSDHTISYWVQRPVQDLHVRMAMCKLLGLPLTPENLHQVTHQYAALYGQCCALVRNEMALCEQVDPLFMRLAIKTLALHGYIVQN